MNLKQLQEKFAAQMATYDAIKAKGADATDEDVKAAQAALIEAKSLQANITEAQEAEALKAWSNTAAPAAVSHDGAQTDGPSGSTKEAKAFGDEPAYVRVTSVKSFRGPDAEKKAYGFGRWCAATLFEHEASAKWCKDNGIALKASPQSENINTQGGFLVPTQYSTDIIDLREQYGVARQLLKIEPMASDTKLVPRRTGGLTVYKPGENNAITDSRKAWDQVALVASKWAVLVYYSTELSEDAFISIGDDLAREIAYAFAVQEDICLVSGDGTSTYFGITGLKGKFTQLTGSTGITNTTVGYMGSAVLLGSGSATAWTSIPALTDFEAMIGKLPQFADTPTTAWLCHRAFYATAMMRAAYAAGGNAVGDLVNGMSKRFLGYPVKISQAMPAVPAASVPVCYLGDFAQGAILGDRRQITIATSEHAAFANDQLAIRGTQRVDLVFHSPGGYDASVAANRTAGPIIAMISNSA